MKHKKNISAKIITESEIKYKGGNEIITAEEKAQYEVFQNGALPKKTIAKWIRNDLTAVLSFIHGILNDPEIFPAVVDLYYKKYQVLHTNNKDHEPKRTTTGQP